MATLRVYKSTIPSINYILPNGKPVIFVFGRFCTDQKYDIDHLDAEIALGHPHLYIDEKEKEIDSEMMDPMAALRAKIIAEYKAAEAKATDPTNDMGTSVQEPLKPANSSDVAVAAAGGSGATLARLISKSQS